MNPLVKMLILLKVTEKECKIAQQVQCFLVCAIWYWGSSMSVSKVVTFGKYQQRGRAVVCHLPSMIEKNQVHNLLKYGWMLLTVMSIDLSFCKQTNAYLF